VSFDLPDDIIGLEEYTESINMMIYADSGEGKTVFGGSAKSPLIIATENGTIAAARQGSKGKMWDARRLDNFFKAYDWLEEHVEKPGFPFDWVEIDTGTELQSLMVGHLVEERVSEGVAKNLNPNKVDLNEYGEMHEMFRRYVRKFNDLPVNVCWMAQAMMTEDEEGNEFRMPQFQGKGNQMSMWMASKMHCYGYLHKATVTNKETGQTRRVRRIRWQPSETVKAKDRFDALGEFTTNKTLAQITQMIEASAGVDEPTPAPKKAPAKKVAPAKAAATA
jgi:hypothetical protein